MEATSKLRHNQALEVDNTQQVIELGAFGASLFWVRDKDGEGEPFFRSDRFHLIWKCLGIPWSDMFIRDEARLRDDRLQIDLSHNQFETYRLTMKAVIS